MGSAIFFICGVTLVLILGIYLLSLFRRTVGENSLTEVINMIKHADIQSQLTPRSVSGGDNLYLHIIKKDFPEFNIELAKSDVENNILNIFSYVNGAIYNGEKEVLAFADTLKQKYESISVSNIKVHKTCISDYIKTQDTAGIKFQTAFQYDYIDIEQNQLTAQEKYETEYSSLINTDSLGKNNKAASLRCSYCGAPVKTVGLKTCEYCGNALELIQDRVWKITSITIK